MTSRGGQADARRPPGRAAAPAWTTGSAAATLSAAPPRPPKSATAPLVLALAHPEPGQGVLQADVVG